MIVIDKLSHVPVYEQVVAQIEAHIRLGEFQPEQQLPSVRALSLELGVNPNTLQKAYGVLENRGLCTSAPGSGRYVARHARELLTVQARERLKEFGALAEQLLLLGIQKEELHAGVEAAAASCEKERQQV